MSKATVDVQTDLTTGKKVFILPADPVPVITPMGPAPGELRVSADISGRVTDVRAVLHPRGADVEAMRELLSRLATFPLPASQLTGLAGAKATVTFKLHADALADIHVSVRTAKDMAKLLDEPVLQAGERYAVDDLEINI